jgi:hypothetical protein
VECAEALGKRLESDFSGSTEERLFQAHRLATGRSANSKQIEELVGLHDEVHAQSPDKAWLVLAQVLLNLDETLTY